MHSTLLIYGTTHVVYTVVCQKNYAVNQTCTQVPVSLEDDLQSYRNTVGSGVSQADHDDEEMS